MEPERKPPRTSTRVPNRNPLQTQGLPTSRITTRDAPHKQSYDQGGSPQAELRPGSLPTSRITTRELLAGWLAELAGWLAGRLGGWLAGLLRPRKAQRGPERPREAQRSGAWTEQACRALGWGLPTSRFTIREAPHKQIYDQRSRTRTVQNSTEQYRTVHSRTIPGAFPQAELRPGRLCTHKQNHDQGAGWLVGRRN